MRRSSSWKIRQAVTVNDGLALHHGHDANRDHRVHPSVRATPGGLEGDLSEVLGAILCGGQVLASFGRRSR